MAKIFLLGGTGLIGQRLQAYLTSMNHDVTVYHRRQKTSAIRIPDKENKPRPFHGAIQALTFENFDVVINLAGANIFDSRWSKTRRQEIIDSRVSFTRQIVTAMNELPAGRRPKKLINASAVGFYGTAWTKAFDESSPVGQDFLANLCSDWEKEALKFSGETTIARLGIVLSTQGGMLGKLLPQYKCFLGGKLDSGKQWLSWIHIEDAVRAIEFLIGSAPGVFNLVAPHCIRQEFFAKELSKILHRKAFLNTPEILLRMVLGERATYLITGQKVLPNRLLKEGFEFKHGQLNNALNHLIYNS